MVERDFPGREGKGVLDKTAEIGLRSSFPESLKKKGVFMPSFWEKGRFAVIIFVGAVLVSGFQAGLAFSQEAGEADLAPGEEPGVELHEEPLSPGLSPEMGESAPEDPFTIEIIPGDGLGKKPGEENGIPNPSQPSSEDPAGKDVDIASDDETESGGSQAVNLSLLEAIQAALKGNRQYLDRVDRVRESFGIGEVDLDREVAVTVDETGATGVVLISGEVSGVAATQSQFQTSISPTVGLSRSKTEGSTLSGSESYGLSLSKRFQTGGNLAVSSSLSTSEFENPGSSMRVSYSQPLLRNAGPLVVLESVTNAKSELRQQEIALECCDPDSRQGLIFEVISQYYSILNQKELVVIAEKAVERAEKLYKATEAKLSVELATQLDVSRAEVQLSGQRNSLNQARQDLGNSEEAFKVLLGMNPRDNVVLSDSVVYDPSEESEILEEDLEKFVEIALQNRSDLKIVRIKVEDAERKLRISKRDFLPNLNSNFGYSVSNVAGLQNDSDANEGSWNANLSLSYPLPLRGPKINIANRTVALQRERRQVIEKNEEIVQQIKTNIRNVIRGQATISILADEIKGAEKKLKIANFRFRRGLASNFDVVDAENNVILAKQRLTRAIIDLKLSRAQLKRDMGVLSHEG